MRIDLHYGEGFLNLSVEGRSVQLLTPRKSEATLDISSEVLLALEGLRRKDQSREGLSNAKSISIAVDLQQGFGQTEMLVEEVLKYFQSLSALERVSLVSGFMQESRTPEKDCNYEIKTLVTKEDSRLLFAGETPTHSTPVFVESEYVESDYRMSLGTIHPHAFYGATGGPVSTLLSVCGEKTVARNKKIGTTGRSVLFDQSSCSATDTLEGCSLIGVDCMLNTVADHQGNLDLVTSGRIEEEWSKGVHVSHSLASVGLTNRSDIAVVSAGGYPRDSTLTSSIQSLLSGYLATEHGGVVLLVAECRDGAGLKGFVDGVSKHESEEAMIAAAESSFQMGMETARLFWKVIQSRTVILCSRLRRSLVEEHLRCHAVRDPEEGVELARKMITSKPRIALIPYGSDTIPRPGVE